MRLVDYIKQIINRNKGKLVLEPSNDLYKELINSNQIKKIINDMPQELNQMEKAYYIYIELGKIVKENPKIVFSDIEGKIKQYNDKMDNTYYGICKSISELYVKILSDSRLGIKAELVKKSPDSPITHIDTIIIVDGKKYIANLISDLSRIKTGRRVNAFGFDLSREEKNLEYKKRLEKHYGKISSLTRKDIEELDKKLGYSFFVPKFFSENERGLYTDDTVERLRIEMDNPQYFKEYVLNNKDVPEEDMLKYKLNYVFQNINGITEFNSNDIQYLENIRYYKKILTKILSPEELSRIYPYVLTINNDLSNIISIVKVKTIKKSDNNISNTYYLYSKEGKRYIEKTPKEMKELLDNLGKEKLKIVGMIDMYNPRKIEELEIE